MNPYPLNYCTLEPSRRLVEAGIVLETDCWRDLGVNPDKIIPWPSGIGRNHPEIIPAPSMAELWRELPELYEGYRLIVYKYGDKSLVAYEKDNEPYILSGSANPADAFAELLIWVSE